ncbi:MAG: HAMP domain-containing histidine kinase, partial [Desulfamplus sp.]|nr:HAMP domain-containing histidine kinase [Desulfamplus sp.]
LQYAAAVFLPLLVLLAAAFVWSWTLRHTVARRTLELSESRQQISTLSDNLPDGYVYQIVADGEKYRFTYVSAGVEHLHGVSAREVMADPMLLYGQVIEEDRHLIAEQEVLTQAGLARFYVEVRYRRPSGEIRWLLMTSSPRRLPDQSIVANGMGIDISDRKRAEDAVKEARKLLEFKNKELEQLVYVTSHDLRSPLVNVDGFSRELSYSLKEIGALMENGKDPAVIVKALLTEFPDMEQSISRIRASAAQMDNLLKALLKLSRTGRAALHIENLDMNQVLGKLAPSFAYRLQAGGIQLNIGPLPPCRGDAVQVTQVFANLIDNAIKYRDKERPGVITISGGSADSGRTLYQVADNGMGIDALNLQKIFELFYRLKPKEREGEGIGLTMVRQILLRMGGEITVESNLGAGSVFSVSLPAAKV